MRRGILGLFLVLIVVLLVVSTYRLYPRRSVDVYLLYHEAIGGGGVGGIIDVNVMVKNTGNRRADYVEGHLSVVDEGGGEVYRLNISLQEIRPGGIEEVQGYFIGDHYRHYRIEVNLRYSIGGRAGASSRFITIEEDYMNVIERFELTS